MTIALYGFILVVLSLERLVELIIARRNTKWSLAQGGFEVAPRHYPYMVVIHIGLIVGSFSEVYFLKRPFNQYLFQTMLVLSLLCQGLRWWVITTLKKQWNTRIIIVPGLSRITNGPYRWLTHPNYLAVIIEGIAIPMMYSAWITALCFTISNLLLLSIRIRHENAALEQLSQLSVRVHRASDDSDQRLSPLEI